MKRILVTGLCTLHWGRLQYGNVGNYYIIEPMFRLLHKYFPEYEILTTFQMDSVFIQNEQITVLPMELYYSWRENELEIAQEEYKIVKKNETRSTSYIDILKDVEYVINVSGDMWGDNAEHVGKNRFAVDCLKMRTAQLLGKKTILYAVTPGPFFTAKDPDFLQSVFSGFSLVVVREKISIDNLKKWELNNNNIVYAPCPSFIFEPNSLYSSRWTHEIKALSDKGIKICGMTFGGFNMPIGPYDMWPREEKQYDMFVKVISHMILDLKLHVVLFSHTNGFDLPPNFRLKNGRDFQILEKLYEIISNRPELCQHITLIDEPMLPSNLKKVISMFDMLFTGRVHASVASASQYIPTVFLEYDRRVIYSDKMLGFSSQFGMEEYVCSPENTEDVLKKVDLCFANRLSIRKALMKEIPIIQKKAESIYETIRGEKQTDLSVVK